MSSQPNSQNAVTSSDPEIGVRNRSEHSRRVHRIDPDSDDLEPACCRKHEDAEFKRVSDIERLTAFNRFDRCQNPECFGGEPEADDEKELIADGGRPNTISTLLLIGSKQPMGGRATDGIRPRSVSFEKIWQGPRASRCRPRSLSMAAPCSSRRECIENHESERSMGQSCG